MKHSEQSQAGVLRILMEVTGILVVGLMTVLVAQMVLMVKETMVVMALERISQITSFLHLK